MQPNFVIIAPQTSKRVDLFQDALYRLGLPPARHVPYLDLIEQRSQLGEFLQEGSIVRIESPGRCFEVERSLLELGAEEAEQDGCAFLPADQCARLEFDKGLILFSRQWYFGFCRAMKIITAQISSYPSCRLMNGADDIALMFDKTLCQKELQRADVKVARSLGEVNSFEQLHEQMRLSDIHRVFIKLAHGSSASGVVAYQTNSARTRHKAITTVEMVRRDGHLFMYNTRRIRNYENEAQIAELVDALCRHRVHVEAWLPKACQNEQSFDLRIVVVAGCAAHAVVRLSRSPFTNLHLLNERGDLEALKQTMGASKWKSAIQLCETAMLCFPRSLYGGVDLLIQPDLISCNILEVNAFGDLLPGIYFDGRDTYEMEILAALSG